MLIPTIMFDLFIGHLNGKTDRHLSLQACPSYHNLTMSECAALRQNAESQLSHWSSISTSKFLS